MIGNDVVDLRLADTESNWKRKGFLEKVFSEKERKLIETAKNQDLLVWLLWSMKEAGYKAHQRRFQLSRKLNWREQKCELVRVNSSSALGVVEIGEERYYSSSSINLEAVFTLVINNKNTSHTNRFLKGSSNALKPLFLQEFSDYFQLPFKDLQIRKNKDGIPVVLHKQRPQGNSFSFTGHGRFSAFSLALTNC